METLEARIAAKAALMPSGCIEWQGYRDPNGYGTMSVAGKFTYGHREAYKLAHGGIPEGLFVLHGCDNPPCCNPAHLRAGTQVENVQDRMDRGRSKSLGRVSKLSDDDVRAIRVLHADGMSQSAIGRQYGMPQGCISKLVRGLSFKKVV